MSSIKNALMTTTQLAYAGIFTLFLSALLASCSDPENNYSSDTPVGPTEGLITRVRETEEDVFKIVDEVPIADPSQSLIVTEYLDGKMDTMTVAMAAAMDTTARDTTKQQRSHRSASRGFFFFMMYRSMWGGSHRPSPGAYVDNNAYRRVNNTTGTTLRNSAARSTSSGGARAKSGFGSGRSTRSSGG